MKRYYGAINGMRTIAAFGIIMMHIQANNKYKIGGVIYNTIIHSFTNLVFLFMVISAFCMCCGHYEEVLDKKIDFPDFYEKRFRKVLPFFGILVLIDIIVSPSVSSLYEAFADLTLLFGFLPGFENITVIGVGWFLGLIFVFYISFPFFCVLCKNKISAWIAFGISIIYNYVCSNYFKIGRSNILYSSCFFLAGGLIYLYRDEISKLNRWIVLAMVAIFVYIYYVSGCNIMMCLLVSAVLVIYAMVSPGGILENRITSFFSSISMEIYLSHMFIFRIIEILKLNTFWGDGWIQYILTTIIVISGTAVFAVAIQKSLAKISDKLTFSN